jgi:3-oxoacyl-[acyl-carrier-protein] synthase-1
MNPLRISTYTVTSAVGAGRAAHAESLRAGTTGLGRVAFDTNTLDCWLGEVRDFDVPLTGELAAFDCRNNRLAEFALNQDGFLDAVAESRARHGAARVGVFVGTSTSGVQHTELAYRARDAASGALPAWLDQRHTQNIFFGGRRSWPGASGSRARPWRFPPPARRARRYSRPRVAPSPRGRVTPRWSAG